MKFGVTLTLCDGSLSGGSENPKQREEKSAKPNDVTLSAIQRD
ncbi:hypothetical protein [uncultured Spongiibacter sp.]|nr:hypothetical protein [uncultured Spongiibacter sp.]